jgi:hypothetical protein
MARDYAAHAAASGDDKIVLHPSAERHGRIRNLVLFLGPRLTDRDRGTLDDLLRLAGESATEFIAVVSTFRGHFGDRDALRAEEYVLARAEELPARVAVFRPSDVVSPRSRATAWLRRLGFLYPLVPRRLRGCCLDGGELFAAIEAQRRAPSASPESSAASVASLRSTTARSGSESSLTLADTRRPRGPRVFTLLGPNRPWRERMAEHGARGPWRFCLTAACAVLSLLMVGHIAAFALVLLARRRPTLRRWCLDTLRPGSLAELQALGNPLNQRYVKVVGYNNGVVHFGQRHPGKTVVSTVGCNRMSLAGPDILRADCGATVRKARDFLAAAGLELPVVPNYSYVALGTAFFVPIHGSAADFSTIADTITRVVLYDPIRDRTIDATRADPDFREHVFNLQSEVVLLELDLTVKPRSRYYVRRETLCGPTSRDILEALRDGKAANVEIRKSSAARDEVTVARYYKDPGETPSPVLELPRDALGRLWDRLEENPVTSFLMHALTRHFAWHVELFFTEDEFAKFWEGHRGQPLRKLQLRYIRRDGMPHSPFREHDCVSIDLFLFRWHRKRVAAWLRETFSVVRFNPGKQSR